VVDEAFDVWEVQKNPQDYHLYFGEWWRRDLSSMVMRDRNHPSVVIWSIANEVPERVQPRGVELGQQMKSLIQTLDTARPIMVAVMEVSGGGGQALDPGFEYADIAGYQYLPHFYESDHVRHPDRVMVGSESFPRQVCQNLVQAKKNAFVIGDFVWTGMDHLGEAAIGNAQLSAPARPRGGQGAVPGAAPGATPAAPAGAGMMISYPWFVNYSGDIDLTGQAKPQWYHRRVAWGLSKLEMAVQRPVPQGRTENVSGWGWSDELRSWTWPGSEGKTVKVRVYSSGDQVRLLLNGKEIGAKPVSPETDMGPDNAPNQPRGLIAEFETPYEPGELKAIALSKGQPIAELFFKTVGKPAKLRLTADRASIRRDRNDLSYVTVEVVDQAGELVPDAVVPVSLSVSGAAELAAAGSASPKDVESFRRTRPKTFHGRCLAIVRPKGAVGTATVRAQADGLAPASIMVRVS
jgi:beta-galactosidase